ncbi:MAG: lipoyl(octanoyl) transferase LipB [Bacteroidota bacterium]
MRNILATYLGLTDYKTIWDYQRELHSLRSANIIPDVLLLNEHRHVYTLGKGSDENHLLANEDFLKSTGAEVYHIDRGGDITYHGPGQLVGYPILNLGNYYKDIHRYLRDIEEVIIRVLNDFDLKGEREPGFTGVWVKGEKIAAIGVKVSRWITMHGFAFNINTDLKYFDSIIPCGIFHKGVTSLQQLIGKDMPLEEVAKILINRFGDVFNAEMEVCSPEIILNMKRQLTMENH